MPTRAADEDQKPADESTISSIMAGSGEGRRAFLRFAWVLAGVAGLFVLGALVKPFLWPIPLSEQAEEIVALPYGAKVLKVEHEPDRSMGEVWFTLPEPKGPGSALGEVWAKNGLPASMVGKPVGSKPKPGKGKPAGYTPITGTGKSPFPTYSYSDGYSRRTLSYDAKTRQYHYQNARIPYGY